MTTDPAPRPGPDGGQAAKEDRMLLPNLAGGRERAANAAQRRYREDRKALLDRLAALEAALSDDAVERLSAAVHEGWMAHQRAAGFLSSRSKADGEEFMVPYADLSEGAKEIDRATVRAVLAAQRAVLAGAGEEGT